MSWIMILWKKAIAGTFILWYLRFTWFIYLCKYINYRKYIKIMPNNHNDEGYVCLRFLPRIWFPLRLWVTLLLLITLVLLCYVVMYPAFCGRVWGSWTRLYGMQQEAAPAISLSVSPLWGCRYIEVARLTFKWCMHEMIGARLTWWYMTWNRCIQWNLQVSDIKIGYHVAVRSKAWELAKFANCIGNAYSSFVYTYLIGPVMGICLMPFILNVKGIGVHTGWLFDRASALSSEENHKNEPCQQ